MPYSVNQRLLSGPVMMARGPELAVGVANSVIVPPAVILPILLAPCSVNQTLLSGPEPMPYAELPLGTLYDVQVPLIVIFPMAGPAVFVTQRLPSGPETMFQAAAALYSVTVPPVVI